MKHVLTLLISFLLTSLTALHAAETPRAATNPNILVILADDK